MGGGRRKTYKTLSGPERTKVLRVLRYFEKERNPQNGISIVNVFKRTSLATGVSVDTVQKLRKEAKMIKTCLGYTDDAEVTLPTPDSRKKNPTDKNELKSGLRKIIDIYQQEHNKMMPLSDIFICAKKYLKFPAKIETLKKILVDQLGYETSVLQCKKKKKRKKCNKLVNETEKSSVTSGSSIKGELDEFNEDNIRRKIDDVDIKPYISEPERIVCEVDIKMDAMP